MARRVRLAGMTSHLGPQSFRLCVALCQFDPQLVATFCELVAGRVAREHSPPRAPEPTRDG